MAPEHSPAPLPDWLTRHAPQDWIRQGLGELGRAQTLLRAHDRSAALVGLRRAAGMALNGALAVQPRPWGRTYVEHLQAVAEDAAVPAPVREAAKMLNDVRLEAEPNVVRLTTPREGTLWVEAAKTLMAHAYAVVHGSAGKP